MRMTPAKKSIAYENKLIDEAQTFNDQIYPLPAVNTGEYWQLRMESRLYNEGSYNGEIPERPLTPAEFYPIYKKAKDDAALQLQQ